MRIMWNDYQNTEISYNSSHYFLIGGVFKIDFLNLPPLPRITKSFIIKRDYDDKLTDTQTCEEL